MLCKCNAAPHESPYNSPGCVLKNHRPKLPPATQMFWGFGSLEGKVLFVCFQVRTGHCTLHKDTKKAVRQWKICWSLFSSATVVEGYKDKMGLILWKWCKNAYIFNLKIFIVEVDDHTYLFTLFLLLKNHFHEKKEETWRYVHYYVGQLLIGFKGLYSLKEIILLYL